MKNRGKCIKFSDDEFKANVRKASVNAFYGRTQSSKTVNYLWETMRIWIADYRVDNFLRKFDEKSQRLRDVDLNEIFDPFSSSKVADVKKKLWIKFISDVNGTKPSHEMPSL